MLRLAFEKLTRAFHDLGHVCVLCHGDLADLAVFGISYRKPCLFRLGDEFACDPSVTGVIRHTAGYAYGELIASALESLHAGRRELTRIGIRLQIAHRSSGQHDELGIDQSCDHVRGQGGLADAVSHILDKEVH